MAAGLNRHGSFCAIAKTMPVVTAVASLLSTQNMGFRLLNRRPGKNDFFLF
jgi:hypothetical protein